MKTRLEAVNAVTALNEVLPRSVPLHERISVIPLDDTPDGYADPLSRKNLEDCFDYSDPFQKKISEMNMKMVMELRKRQGVGVWLSLPGYHDGGYHETGKILLATRPNGRTILYDMTGQTFSAREFASFMASFSSYAHDGYFFLRDQMAWEILESVIPAPLAWQAIQNDQARIKFEKKVKEDMHYGDSRKVYQERHGVDINLACQTRQEETAVLKSIGPDGKIRTFVHNCGLCHGEINDWMAPGDECPHCGETYLGVC